MPDNAAEKYGDGRVAAEHFGIVKDDSAHSLAVIYNVKQKTGHWDDLVCEYKQQAIEQDSLQLKDPRDGPINLAKRFQDCAMLDKWKCPKCGNAHIPAKDRVCLKKTCPLELYCSLQTPHATPRTTYRYRCPACVLGIL